MMLDIVGAQRLYGASTSSTFAGGQVYGFNSNIADASKRFYDFTQNVDPIVTIYNTGTNNTLDVSGFGSDSVINLNPGTFSTANANGMTNNIGIAYGTRIDRAVGGSGDDTFYTNGNGNTIDGGAGVDTVVIEGKASDYIVVTDGDGSRIVTNRATGATDTLTNVESLRFEAPVCFTTGTRIAAIRGGRIVQVPVEALCVGDIALTATGDHRPIRWIGRRRIVPAEHRAPSDQWPVRVLAGAFGVDADGAAVPARDLRLSPGHPVLVGGDADHREGMLVPIMCLVNGTSIAREAVAEVVYWHVELDRHDLLLAEGLPAESYFECGSRPWFGLAAPSSEVFDPDFAAADLAGRCRPVALDGPQVAAERDRLSLLFSLRLDAHGCWPRADTPAESWIAA